MLILPAIYQLIGPYDQSWAVHLTSFIVLSVCYWQSITQPRFRKAFIILQLLTVSLIGALYSPWNLAFAFYPGLIIGLFLPEHYTRRYTGLMGLCLLVSLTAFFTLHENSWHFYWLPIVITIVTLPFVVRMYRKSLVINQELKVANEEITRLIKNEERQRISRDLHDSVGHTLSLITLKSELMERLIRDNPEEAIEEAKAIQDISRSVLLQIRKLISDMQAVDIEEELKHAEEVFDWAKISFHYEVRFEIDEVSPITRNILGMCLRECITNVLKHSGAKNCTVALRANAGKYVLSVEDNGRGFTLNNNELQDFGNGLHGMKERLLLIGGKIHIDSNSEGTKVAITVPKI